MTRSSGMRYVSRIRLARKLRDGEHDARSLRGATDEPDRTFRESALEELRVGLEQHVVDGDDFGHERKRWCDVLGVEHVETVHELEHGNDEREPDFGRSRKHPVMGSVHELSRRVWLEAEDAQLVVVLDEFREGLDQLQEIGAAALRFAVQVVGVDADAHPKSRGLITAASYLFLSTYICSDWSRFGWWGLLK